MYIHVYIYMLYRGDFGKNSLKEQWVFPTLHKEGAWNSKLECKSKGLEWV